MAEPIATVAAAATGVMETIVQAKTVFVDPFLDKVNLSENVEEIHYYLSETTRILVSAKMDFENEVERNRMMKPSEAYLGWSNRVSEIEKEVKELVANYKKNMERFVVERWIVAPISGFKGKMKNMYKRVHNLREEGDQIKEKILVNRPPEPVVNMRAPDIKKFKTLQNPLEQILNLLKSNEVKGIRIHGPLGIGKTTILLNLNNHEQVAKMFGLVIWLKVSKEDSKENLSRERLQQCIVQRLQLRMGGTSNADEVAQKISMELKDKNYLLLLDDVKENIKLDEIGIPHNNNRSKIVLTTRLHHVCPSMVNRGIKVEYLSKDEAWKMTRPNILATCSWSQLFRYRTLRPIKIERDGGNNLIPVSDKSKLEDFPYAQRMIHGLCRDPNSFVGRVWKACYNWGNLVTNPTYCHPTRSSSSQSKNFPPGVVVMLCSFSLDIYNPDHLPRYIRQLVG